MLHASKIWAFRCMEWKMGKGSWVGLGLHFTRNWPSKRNIESFPPDSNSPSSFLPNVRPRDKDEDDQASHDRRRARALRISGG